ncbi:MULTISPECIES: hypothetical protein [Streptomyces]|uniref:hypothetical protein n=1 Tax=Streptomyces TaxID=1883 RepID=UPI0036C61264
MPQAIGFHLPFPSLLGPDPEGARQHNPARVRGMGVVGEGRSPQWQAPWDMPLLAAHGFPRAQGPALDLCADAMAFFFVSDVFVSDDRFDGPLGQDPARAATECRQLIDIVHGASPAAGADACSVAFADLSAHSLDGTHPSRVARPPVSSVWVAADDDVAVGHPGHVPGPPAHGTPYRGTRALRTVRGGFGIAPGERHVHRVALAAAGCSGPAVVRHAAHRSSSACTGPLQGHRR